MFACMVEIHDLSRAGEVELGNVPDPFRPIPHDHPLQGATPAAFPGFQIDPLAEFLSGFDGARKGGGIGIPDGVALSIPLRLAEYTSQFDLPRVVRTASRFPQPA